MYLIIYADTIDLWKPKIKFMQSLLAYTWNFFQNTKNSFFNYQESKNKYPLSCDNPFTFHKSPSYEYFVRRRLLSSVSWIMYVKIRLHISKAVRPID